MNGPWVLLVAFCGVVWLGFVLHTSGGAGLVLGKYSGSYTMFLAALSALWIAVAAWGWPRRERLGRLLGGLLLAGAITGLLALLVLPGTYIYLHHRSLQQQVFSPLGDDAHAFWQIERAPEAPAEPGGFRVLALGGSTTYGAGLERSETYPALLEARLRERFPGRSVTVLNAGVHWHTSMHSLIRYVTRYADWSPHVVLVMHAFNDGFQASEGRLTSGRFRADYGHFFGALGNRVKPRDRFAAKVASLITENWLARTWYSDLRDRPAEPERRPVDLARPRPSLEANLRRIAQRARQDGAHVALLTQPFLYRPGMPDGERKALFYDFYYKDYALVPSVAEQAQAMRGYNDATRLVARQTAAELVDLAPRIPKTRAMMYDDVHYTREGARRVADVVLEALPWDRYLAEAGAAP